MLGSHCWDGLLDHVDEAGSLLCGRRCPLLATMDDGQAREVRRYLRHRDGHRQAVHVRAAPPLVDGRITGAVEVFNNDADVAMIHEQLAEVRRLAMSDPLTGIGNRRYLDSDLRHRFGAWQRYGWPFGMLLLDIDHFKQVNDDLGHEVGDATLRMVAKTLAFGVRSGDTVGRWGGEEFLVLLAKADEQGLADTAERLRTLVEQSYLVAAPRRVGVTVSVGGAIVQPDDQPSTLLRRSDALLYQAKHSGRNRIALDADAQGDRPAG